MPFRKLYMAFSETPYERKAMLTIEDIENLIKQMQNRQLDRLLKSKLSMDEFHAQREELQVLDELHELAKVVESMRTLAQTHS